MLSLTVTPFSEPATSAPYTDCGSRCFAPPLRLGNRLEPGITHFLILSCDEVSALPPGRDLGPHLREPGPDLSGLARCHCR
jgi:hypothetical protein